MNLPLSAGATSTSSAEAVLTQNVGTIANRGLEFSADMDVFKNRKDEQYLAKLVKNDDILANNCNLSVSNYVEQEDTREEINISEVNTKLESFIAEGNELNLKIEAIIKELGEE